MFKSVAILVLVSALAAARLFAGEAPVDPAKLAMTTERVVIFKDGFALFVKKASATADAEGRVFTEQVPDGAVLGCFWATTDAAKVLGMRAEWDERKEERVTETACISTLELLRANKGKVVKLRLTSGNNEIAAGTLVEVLDMPADPKAETPAPTATVSFDAWGRPVKEKAEAGKEVVRELVPRGGQLVVIDTADQGRLVLPVSMVQTVAGADLITKMARKELVTTKNKRLSFELGKENAGKKAELKIFYFTEGVRWIPTYRLGADDPAKAELSLQGEILNEAEDITNAAVDLVVGVPNFRFKDTPSPLSLEQMMRSSLAAAAPGVMGNGNAYSNASFGQRAGEWRGRNPQDGENPVALAPELAAAGQSDMFVYSAKTMSLKKGARATLPLWQSAVVLRDVYTLDIKIVRDPRSGYMVNYPPEKPNSRSPLKLAENEVWHQFEIANAGNVPWTTGAALIMRNNVPLGQELLTYTAPRGVTLLPVTVAVNMCGSIKEEELGRQQNALNWDGTQFALIRKKATVTVSNFRTEKSNTRITVSLGGKAEKISDNGKVNLNDYRQADWQNGDWRGVNNHSDVSWELELAPGEVKTLTFEFSFYVR